MTERETFERAVCENPEDDTARLVFADWLDEHGEADRAELIRYQIENGVAFRRDERGRWRNKAKQGVRLPTAGCWRSLNSFLSEAISKPFSIARGFVDSVECTLAELGKECLAGYAREPSRMKFVPSLWAVAVMRALPVTRFVITDREPARLVDLYVWRCTNDGNSALYELAEVPVWLEDGLGRNQGPHSNPDNGRYRRWEYATRELAIDALALAAGRLVRSHVYPRPTPT